MGPMAVTFDFNTAIDRASDVAQEMISELQLPPEYKGKVENAINIAIQTENNQTTQIIGKSLTMSSKPEYIETMTPSKPQTIPIDIKKDDLFLNDLSSYLNNGDIEIDEKSQDQIIKKRDELLKEYNDFIVTKQELLKLRIESITDQQLREQEILKMKQKIERKKKEQEQQYENFINDYIKIAQLTLTSKTKKKDFAQNFMFEQDPQFQNLMNSKLSHDDKYKLQNDINDFRQQIVDKYLSYFSSITIKYSQQIKSN